MKCSQKPVFGYRVSFTVFERILRQLANFMNHLNIRIRKRGFYFQINNVL